MKIKYWFTLFILPLLTGCITPDYKDNWPPEKVYIKQIVDRDDGKQHYTMNFTTLLRPKGDDYLQEKHLEMFNSPPKAGDWENIWRFSLLVHENTHAINDHEPKFLYFYNIFMRKKAKKVNEMEAYEAQIRYLMSMGVTFSTKIKNRFVALLTNPSIYNGLFTRQEAVSFVQSVTKGQPQAAAEGGTNFEDHINKIQKGQ